MKNNTEKAVHDFISNTEDTIKAIQDPKNIDLVRERANEVADNARKATGLFMENFKRTFYKKED